MSAPKVDVLAVLDRLWNRVSLHNADQVALSNEIAAARAAVAELIEADREYDASHVPAWNGPVADDVIEAWRQRSIAACRRRVDALARIGGAA